jgi:ABC-type Fe3+-siderophore transport system permease subunit
MSRRRRAVVLGLVAAAVVVVVVAPLVGTVPLRPGLVIEAIVHPAAADPLAVQIVSLRLPRVVLGLLVGAFLAVAGASFQTLLGNPLATPYTVGVAAAGSFGAFLALAWPLIGRLGPLGAVPAQAVVWSAFELLLLAFLARRARWGGTALILAGVTFNFLFAAGTLLVRLLADPFRLQAMDRWLMGGLDIVGWRAPVTVAVMGLPALVVLLAVAPALDQLAFGDAVAHGRGVPVARLRGLVLAAGAWLTAACVAQAGPIAFVGLLVPHGVRLLIGSSHRRVLPASVVAGAAFLVAADALARTVPLLGRGAELPVGVITALVGGPVFLLLLARRSSANRSSIGG